MLFKSVRNSQKKYVKLANLYIPTSSSSRPLISRVFLCRATFAEASGRLSNEYTARNSSLVFQEGNYPHSPLLLMYPTRLTKRYSILVPNNVWMRICVDRTNKAGSGIFGKRQRWGDDEGGIRRRDCHRLGRVRMHHRTSCNELKFDSAQVQVSYNSQ